MAPLNQSSYFPVKLLPRTITSSRRELEPDTFDLRLDCQICRLPLVLPSRAGCPHSFCYFCVKSNLGNGNDFTCPVCGQTLSENKLVQVSFK